MRPFEYADYEADPRLRDLELIARMQAPYVELFRGCRRVLDVACGSGIFLNLLAKAGIPALGVERNEQVAAAARGRGLEVIHADAFDYLAAVGERFDGVYCSHFIEHLPFDQLLLLIERVANRLEGEGRLVLVFPNPESIRMQLFGFWKDPEHVRFYHSDLVELVCRHYGLLLDSTNKDDAPLFLEPVILELPDVDPLELHESMSADVATQESRPRRPRFLDRAMKRLGLVTRSDLEEFRKELRASGEGVRAHARLFGERLGKSVEEYNRLARNAADALNQIWSRPDEIVMVCRKREGSHAR
jgi:O-antigen chain-terminating methyltransferase